MLGTIAGVIEVRAEFAENAGCDTNALCVTDERIEKDGDRFGVGEFLASCHRTPL
jgi:hypothetical protein